jgi:hypothetical protein
MAKLLPVLIMALSAASHAQDKCDCAKVLEQLIVKSETEYPGFKDKAKDTLAYESFKKQMRESANGCNRDDCITILKKYLEYFKDGHLVINKKGNSDGNPQAGAGGMVDVDIKSFKKYLGRSRDGMEGIWTSGGYKVGIKKRAGGHDAFIISSQNASWKPKEIKFTLGADGKATYYWGNHAQTFDTYAFLKGSFIQIKEANVVFVKEFPAPLLTEESMAAEIDELEGFYLKPLSDRTMLFRISSFSQENTDRITKLIARNKLLLERHENLILDVRGNGGGTDYGIRPILPYLYTNPVRFLGGEYLVTRPLVDSLTNWADGADQVKDAEEIKQVRSDIRRMEGKIGEFVPYSSGDGFGFTRQESVFANPRNVVILADGRCGSTTEKLLYDARQSKKVKIFGTPTYGSLDYVLVYEFPLDCGDYALYMPTVRMMRLPDYRIDNIGIQPDVYMDKHIGDWVQYAKEYLEN